MYARATPEHHGKSWFSSVSLRSENIRDEDTTSFGQLRVLFKCPVWDNNMVRTHKEFALIKLYSFVGVNNVCDCLKLKWEEAGRTSFRVVETSSIIQAVQVIPDFVTNDEYFVNKFKF